MATLKFDVNSDVHEWLSKIRHQQGWVYMAIKNRYLEALIWLQLQLILTMHVIDFLSKST